MKTMFTRLLLGIFFSGVVAGPGYYVYCTHFSGKSVSEQVLFSLDMTPISVEGVTGRNVKGEDNPIPPISLHLAPEMNPIAILVAGNYVPPLTVRQETQYKVRLLHKNTALWDESVKVQGKARSQKDKPLLGYVKIGRMGLNSFSYHVQNFSVQEAGEYDLIVTRTGEPRLHVANMKAKIRRNVVPSNVSVVIAGCVALGVGIIGLVTIGIINKKAGG